MAQIEMKQGTRHKVIMNHKAFPITSRFAITLDPATHFSGLAEDKKALIQETWEKEQKARGGKLHEGAILSAITFDQKGLLGQFVPYKYYFAQLLNPILKADLKIVPVSLCGITIMEEDLIFAKRASWVTDFPGYYELAPSGGIRAPDDPEVVDIKQQLLDELFEEVFINSNLVKSVKYFALVHDLKEDTIELSAEIRLKPGSLVLSSSSEYPQVMTVPFSELSAFTAKHANEIVPLSLVLLKIKGLI